MRLKNSFLLILTLAILGLFVMNCEGPAGKDGVDGVDGVDGLDGTPGVAGNLVCIECHNTAKKDGITGAYQTSGHFAATTLNRGGSQSCARCHGNEGFVETQFTGQDTTATAFTIVTPISCGTCHDFHNSLDFENDGPDYALRATHPVALIIDPTVIVDFGSSSNTCANCHQARTNEPYAANVAASAPTDSFTVTSTHYGPHHGPQSNLLSGNGFAELAGTMAYPTESSHLAAEATCVTCHMGENANGVGGHSWHTSLANCTAACHTGITSFDNNGAQTAIVAQLEELKVLLQTAGIVDDAGHVVKGTYPMVTAQSFFNYIAIEEDRSKGVHNPAYAKALLTNSIEAMQ